MREASRVISPDQHALTAAMVSAQEDTATRYERMLVSASQEAARHGRHTHGRGGAGNSKAKLPKLPKPAKTRSKSRLINYGSLRASRRTSVKLDTPIPEDTENVDTIIKISKKDLGKMRKVFAKSLLALRTSSAAASGVAAAAAPSTPPSSVLDITSPSPSSSVPSSPESSVASDSTSPSSVPSSPLTPKSASSTSSEDTAKDPTEVTIVAIEDDPGTIFFPPDEDTLAHQLAALQLRKSWKPRARRSTLSSLRSNAESVAYVDFDLMDRQWEDEQEESDEEKDEVGDDEIAICELSLNEVMQALLEEANSG
ncbi:uncharacterized protein B0H18DRAFT_122192 [Fomitopsis serialis]|uniref:uncharacterized protein n=1 Tax=Fomitopsis serialis TaxID=139415 RepID=UPI00200725B8|nr:uncharacterized protein B0H18DRAFT_122192 [Neoantrodia serialis]KAH9914734.1 hypothetical protein B0H18DRAFT_122192 [Neoantrodia serialis]